MLERSTIEDRKLLQEQKKKNLKKRAQIIADRGKKKWHGFCKC
jgi:hypothetical protein